MQYECGTAWDDATTGFFWMGFPRHGSLEFTLITVTAQLMTYSKQHALWSALFSLALTYCSLNTRVSKQLAGQNKMRLCFHFSGTRMTTAGATFIPPVIIQYKQPDAENSWKVADGSQSTTEAESNQPGRLLSMSQLRLRKWVHSYVQRTKDPWFAIDQSM